MAPSVQAALHPTLYMADCSSSFRLMYLFLGEDFPDTLPIFYQGAGFITFRTLITISNYRIVCLLASTLSSRSVNSMREGVIRSTYNGTWHIVGAINK